MCDQTTGDPNAQGGLNRGQGHDQLRASGSRQRGQLLPPPGFGPTGSQHGQGNQGFAGGQQNFNNNQNFQGDAGGSGHQHQNAFGGNTNTGYVITSIIKISSIPKIRVIKMGTCLMQCKTTFSTWVLGGCLALPSGQPTPTWTGDSPSPTRTPITTGTPQVSLTTSFCMV
jgi:hypothetical protein